MTKEQKQVKDWMKAFGQDCPDKPTIPSLEVRKLRVMLELEETLEKIKALGFAIYIQSEESRLSMNNIDILEDTDGPNLIDIADASADQKVVTEGTLVACGLVVDGTNKITKGLLRPYVEGMSDPLFDEVMRSNWSKMWKEPEIDGNVLAAHTVVCYDGKSGGHVVKNLDGKVIKPPSYSPADLEPIIEEMKK